MAAALLTACQPSDRGDPPAPTPSATTAAASNIAAIRGVWEPYSRGADLAFGRLDITADKVAFSNLGTAKLAMQGRFGVLTWTAFKPDARDICGDEPPPLVEFRVIEKDTVLAAGTTGQWLEVSFYRRVEAITADRATTLDLCQISAWSR